MAGIIRKMIDSILDKRSGGNSTIYATTKTKLMLKGIAVGKYTDSSEDDPVVIAKLKDIAKELDVKL